MVFFFCVLYFGTFAIIGLSAPGGYYSKFVSQYLNYIDWLRASLLSASKALLLLFNYETVIAAKYVLALKGGKGVRMVYKCAGYGIMGFWGAFILANKARRKKKILWLICGWLAAWCINVVRISLLVIALNNKWAIPLGLDHHTWFNIAAYILIFILIYFYDRSSKKPVFTKNTNIIAG